MDIDSTKLDELTDLTESLKISAESRETLYSMAYHCYYNGKYADAAASFTALALADSAEAKYWIGLGAAQQMLDNFEEALAAYAFGVLLDDKTPIPHFHAAQCLFSLNRIKDGLLALDSAEKLAKSSKNNELLPRIAVMRETWGTKHN